MERGPVLETLLFVLVITAITVLPFVIVIGGVVLLRWRMTKSGRAGAKEPDGDLDEE